MNKRMYRKWEKKLKAIAVKVLGAEKAEAWWIEANDLLPNRVSPMAYVVKGFGKNLLKKMASNLYEFRGK